MASSFPPELVAGGGIMGDLIRQHDWSETDVGSMDTWPPCLVTSVASVLASKFPMTLFWGTFPNLTMIYNDSYIPIVGARHPALGERVNLVWAEIWTMLCPMFQQVCSGEASTFNGDQLLNLTRNNYLEECYMTWSLSPIRAADNSIGGVLNVVAETTRRVLAERRTKTLREFGARGAGIENSNQACKLAGAIFASNNTDIPFSALYLMSPGSHTLTLKSTSGVCMGSSVAPHELLVSTGNSPRSAPESKQLWPVAEVMTQNKCVKLTNLEQRVGHLPSGQWPESAQSAVMCPILGTDRQPCGVLLMGINPRRVFDDDYSGFFELVCGQVSTTINTAKAYEEERNRAEALSTIDKAKTAFFGNVSHEFRTPLTLILGPLEDALADTECPLPPIQRERLVMMQHNTMRLHRLVNSLLDFSKIEAGRMAATYEPVDIVPRTLDLTSVFRSAFEKAGLKLIVDVPENLQLELYVDGDLWEKIVYNLLSNAIKYTINGSVTVALAVSGNMFEVRVQDTGIGISAEELPRVFERFHRADSSAGRSHEGTGIGLALTKELVLLHGGDISCHSVFGEGTTFTVRIPQGYGHLPQKQVKHSPQSTGISKLGETYVQEAMRWLPEEMLIAKSAEDCEEHYDDYMETSDDDDEPKPHSKPYGKVLLVDDNADMREYVSALLRKYWTIVTTCDGVQALSTLKTGSFDLVLSDIMMPLMDGFQFLAAVRADPALKSTPVILLSARAGETDAIQGLEAGADDYLIKPFSGKELIARVSTHLELSKYRRRLERLVDERTKSLAKANADLHQQILERLNAEEALRDSENKYKTLARASPVGIIHTDAAGNAMYLNDRWEEITGYSIADGLGTGWLDLVYPEDKVSVLSAVTQAIENSSISFKLEFRYENKSATPPKIRWVLAQDLPDVTSAGEVKGFVCTLTDITDRKQLEKERYSALIQTELEQRNRAIEAEEHKQQQTLFVDMICHEIRNPLNGILNNIDIMKINAKQARDSMPSMAICSLSNSADSPRSDCSVDDYYEKLELDIECLDAIEKCALHQQVITDDVINASKLESHKVGLNCVNFSPYELVNRVVNLYSIEVTSKQIAMKLNIDLQPNFIVNSDPDRISQILMNLLTNAIKFTEKSAQRSINLSVCVLQSTPTHVILQSTVADTGPGLTEQEQRMLFQRFSQASVKTYHQYGGSGLGLYISKMLVELLGGSINVYSKKGQGTKFVFTIKCNHSMEVPKSPGSPEIKFGEFDSSIYRILVVEDNVVNQKVLARQLTMSGFVCDVANNGKEAVEKFAQGQSDLIFMDIEMPIMNGFEATKEIRTRERNSGVETGIPIIGLSGNARSVHHQMALSAGMNDYIVKPYKREELLGKIRHHLRKPLHPIISERSNEDKEPKWHPRS